MGGAVVVIAAIAAIVLILNSGGSAAPVADGGSSPAPTGFSNSALFGTKFGFDYSEDKTGGNDAGPRAEFSVDAESGPGKIDFVLTRQQDGHYEVTDYTYTS